MAQTEDSKLNHKIALGVGIADATNVAVIMSMFLKDVFLETLKETAKFYLFPIAAFGALIEAILAARQAKLDQYQNGTLATAVVRFVAFLAITAAVIGEVFFGTLFALLSPIIFTATMAGRSIFHAISAYRLRNENPQVARGHLAASVATAFISIAVGIAMLAGKPLFAILGIIGAAIGITYAATQLVKMVRGAGKSDANYDPVATDEPNSDVKLGTTAQLNKTLTPDTNAIVATSAPAPANDSVITPTQPTTIATTATVVPTTDYENRFAIR